MSYRREIPRDLFNEANLLKCYGRIYVNLETAGVPDAELVYSGGAFDVQQDLSTGNLFLANVKLKVRGRECRLSRVLNSQRSWPLLLILDNDDEFDVFSDDGSFSPEMMEFLQGE
jgi:hypothetical protein